MKRLCHIPIRTFGTKLGTLFSDLFLEYFTNRGGLPLPILCVLSVMSRFWTPRNPFSKAPGGSACGRVDFQEVGKLKPKLRTNSSAGPPDLTATSLWSMASKLAATILADATREYCLHSTNPICLVHTYFLSACTTCIRATQHTALAIPQLD